VPEGERKEINLLRKNFVTELKKTNGNEGKKRGPKNRCAKIQEKAGAGCDGEGDKPRIACLYLSEGKKGAVPETHMIDESCEKKSTPGELYLRNGGKN